MLITTPTNDKLKRLGYWLIGIGLAVWLTAVVFASEPTTMFRLIVRVGWFIALAGALIHAFAFIRHWMEAGDKE